MIHELRGHRIHVGGGVQHDVVDAEGSGEVAGPFVHLGLTRDGHVDEGSKVFVPVAGVEVEHHVGSLDDFPGQRKGDAIAHGPARVSGEGSVEVFPVHGTVVDRASQEGRKIGYVYEDQRAGKLARIDLRSDFLEGKDRRVFVSVGSRDETQHRSRAGAMDHGHGNAGPLVLSFRDLEVSRRTCSRLSLDPAHHERRPVLGGGRYAMK